MLMSMGVAEVATTAAMARRIALAVLKNIVCDICTFMRGVSEK